MRQILLFVLFRLTVNTSLSQQTVSKDSIQDDFDIYGFFQVQTVLQDDEHHINDGSTHIGLDFVKRISPNLTFFAQIEIGLSLITSENFDLITNPNSDKDFFDLVSPNNNTFGFSGRLGLVGIDLGKYGKFSVGKQWSVYYDVAGWTDYWYNFGADVTPAYWNDTDGGSSGTGRANNASIYRVSLPSGTNIGLQAQAINSRYSFGASLIQNIKDLEIGASFIHSDMNHIYTDSVANFTNPMKELVAGFRYMKRKTYASLNLTSGENRIIKIDGDYTAIPTWGFESVYSHQFNQKWMIIGGFDYLEARRDYSGKLNSMFNYILSANYNFSKNAFFYAEVSYKNADSELSNFTGLASAIGFIYKTRFFKRKVHEKFF